MRAEEFKAQEQGGSSIFSLLLSNGSFIVLLGILLLSLMTFMGCKLYETYKQNNLITIAQEASKQTQKETEGGTKKNNKTKYE